LFFLDALSGESLFIVISDQSIYWNQGAFKAYLEVNLWFFGFNNILTSCFAKGMSFHN
jgi:hypothetical protein